MFDKYKQIAVSKTKKILLYITKKKSNRTKCTVD